VARGFSARQRQGWVRMVRFRSSCITGRKDWMAKLLNSGRKFRVTEFVGSQKIDAEDAEGTLKSPWNPHRGRVARCLPLFSAPCSGLRFRAPRLAGRSNWQTAYPGTPRKSYAHYRACRQIGLALPERPHQRMPTDLGRQRISTQQNYARRVVSGPARDQRKIKVVGVADLVVRCASVANCRPVSCIKSLGDHEVDPQRGQVHVQQQAHQLASAISCPWASSAAQASAARMSGSSR